MSQESSVKGPERETATGTWNRRVSRPAGALLSAVVPCMNEAEVLRFTNGELVAALERTGAPFEIIYVDDGSTDSTFALLCEFQAANSRIRVIRLARNFGHQAAITAGLGQAIGDAVVLIDADLQDPPDLILEFLEQWRAGYDVAYGARIERSGETIFKRWTAKAFYRLINSLSTIAIPAEAGDFRLMDRKVVDALLAMPERARFIRGMVSWVGFSQVMIPYQRAARRAGTTHYPLVKMVRLAADGVLSFSTTPLRLATCAGFAASVLALGGVIAVLFWRILTHNWVPGWASIIVTVLFIGGVQLICLGVLGEYVGRIFEESKQRPLYLVREALGFEEPPAKDNQAHRRLESRR